MVRRSRDRRRRALLGRGDLDRAHALITAAPPPAPIPAVPVGRSVDGTELRATRLGSAAASRRVLVVGQIHGDEPAGPRIVAALRQMDAPRDTAIWTVNTLNPDGARRRTRQNARGVDLNRNFPTAWQAGPRGRYWPGPRAGSEPETRWAIGLMERIRPQLTIWFHQPYGIVDRQRGADPRLVREYARRTGLPRRRLPFYHGTATRHQERLDRRATAFVVELGPAAPSRRIVLRHAAAARALGAG